MEIPKELLEKLQGDVSILNEKITEEDALKEYIDKSICEVSDINFLYNKGISGELVKRLEGDALTLNEYVDGEDLKKYIDKDICKVSDINALCQRGIDGKLVKELEGDIYSLNKDIRWHDIDYYVKSGICEISDINTLYEKGISGDMAFRYASRSESAYGMTTFYTVKTDIMEVAAKLKKEDIEKYRDYGDTDDIKVIIELIKNKVDINFLKACRRAFKAAHKYSDDWRRALEYGDILKGRISVAHGPEVVTATKKELESIEKDKNTPLNENISQKELLLFEKACVYRNADINRLYEEGIKGKFLSDLVKITQESRKNLLDILNNLTPEELKKCIDYNINPQMMPYLKGLSGKDLKSAGEYLEILFDESWYKEKELKEKIGIIVKNIKDNFLAADFRAYEEACPRGIKSFDRIRSVNFIRELNVKPNDKAALKILNNYGVWEIYHAKEALGDKYSISEIPNLEGLLHKVFFDKNDKKKKIGGRRQDDPWYLHDLLLWGKNEISKANKIKAFCENDSDFKSHKWPGFTMAQQYYCCQYGVRNDNVDIAKLEKALRQAYEKDPFRMDYIKEALTKILVKAKTKAIKKLKPISTKIKKKNPKVFIGVKKSKLKYMLVTREDDRAFEGYQTYKHNYKGNQLVCAVKIRKKEIIDAIKEAKQKNFFMTLGENTGKNVLIIRFPETPEEIELKIKQNENLKKYGLDKIIIFTKGRVNSIKCNSTKLSSKNTNNTDELSEKLNNEKLTVVHFVGQNNKLAEILE